jgi:hypothetical protein
MAWTNCRVLFQHQRHNRRVSVLGLDPEEFPSMRQSEILDASVGSIVRGHLDTHRPVSPVEVVFLQGPAQIRRRERRRGDGGAGAASSALGHARLTLPALGLDSQQAGGLSLGSVSVAAVGAPEPGRASARCRSRSRSRTTSTSGRSDYHAGSAGHERRDDGQKHVLGPTGPR